jgi:YgiT-type zinc finger domain-containing protein
MEFDSGTGSHTSQPAPTSMTGTSTARDQAAQASCPACGGRTERKNVMIALWEGDALALVRDVAALVCAGCHERYFEDDVVMRLDMMRAGGFAAQAPAEHLAVPVYAFAPPGREAGR